MGPATLLAVLLLQTLHKCIAYMPLPNKSCGYPPSGECTTALASLHEYCGTTPPSGLDGTIPDSTGEWTLKHVMMLVRHGDENPPVISGNKTTEIHSTHWEELLENPLPYISHMSEFDVVEIERGIKSNDKLAPKAFFNQNSPSQLTTRGFMQNVKLGQFLSKRYAPLLQKVKSAGQVYVRSSRSDRAVQSAAALLTGLVPHMVARNTTHKLKIRYFAKTYHEVMMGIGKNHDVCSVVVESAKAQSKEVYNAVTISQTAYCNNERMPCPTIDGKKHCLNANSLAVLKAMNDRTMCHQWAGSMGGLRASELKAGPFMQDLKRHLRRALDSHNDERVVLFAGHSAILQLALVGLGVYRHICANPPFSSRVTFEVWERKATGIPRRNLRSDGDGQDAEHTRNLKVEKDQIMTNFVRVLYGGKDVTHLIPSCVMKAEPDEIEWLDGKRKLEETNQGVDAVSEFHLCPVDRLFLHYDSGTRLQYDYLPDDCKAVYKKNYNHYAEEFSNDV